MIFLFLFIEIFFTSVFCSFRCTGGPNCHITLNFNQIIPSHQELPRTCSIIDAPSCTIYLKIDYNNKRVNILFNEVPMDIKSLYSMMDPLAANLNASIILRYAVKVRIRKIELYVLIQCRTIDRCADRQLRHFWPRFISLNPRRNIYMPFSKLLFSNTSNVHSCFNDQTNQIEQCLHTNNICWASSNTHRACAEYDKEEANGFIYSYNKVDLPHRLTTENVNYVLTCRVNNCNNNETINRLSKLARQFAENSWSMNNSPSQSFANKHLVSYIDILCLGLLLISK